MKRKLLHEDDNKEQPVGTWPERKAFHAVLAKLLGIDLASRVTSIIFDYAGEFKASVPITLHQKCKESRILNIDAAGWGIVALVEFGYIQRVLTWDCQGRNERAIFTIPEVLTGKHHDARQREWERHIACCRDWVYLAISRGIRRMDQFGQNVIRWSAPGRVLCLRGADDELYSMEKGSSEDKVEINVWDTAGKWKRVISAHAYQLPWLVLSIRSFAVYDGEIFLLHTYESPYQIDTLVVLDAQTGRSKRVHRLGCKTRFREFEDRNHSTSWTVTRHGVFATTVTSGVVMIIDMKTGEWRQWRAHGNAASEMRIFSYRDICFASLQTEITLWI